MNSLQKSHSFFTSSISVENEFNDSNGVDQWLKNRSSGNSFNVEEIPFHLLDKWYFEDQTRNLRHSSGKFFSIEGLRVNTNFGDVKTWDQPIIVQPEVGILGIITKVFNNKRYFLMQAKMEPGNINIIQVSPTVQATKSNYTQVHKGNIPKYLEYFLDNPKSEILIDLLQSEQGGRFYRKKNRNMVIEVHDDIPVYEDFIWLTLGQIKNALKTDNLINMDSRSVLATIPFLKLVGGLANYKNDLISDQDSDLNLTPIAKELIISSNTDDNGDSSLVEVLEWIDSMKAAYYLDVAKIPISDVKEWRVNGSEIIHDSGAFFKVIAVKVKAGNREVVTWTQPLIKEENTGLIGFLVKSIKGVLHFLVQAKVEPGCADTLDIAPTVSCSDYRHALMSSSKPQFIEYFDDPDPGSILYSAIQSEEGGRFFHFQNLNRIIRIKDDELNDIPPNYKWLTLSQMMDLMNEGFMNIESRSLISGISII